MIPGVAFHGIESIEVTPIRHFPPSASCAHEFWSRELIIHGDVGEPYRLNLYSYESAAALEPGETMPMPIACLCGYVGPDVEHAPPNAKERLAELARRWTPDEQPSPQEDPDDAA